MYDALGDAVPVWLTVNEPKTVVQNGYLHGHHAPGHRDPDAAYLVAHHLQLAHGLAVRALRATGSAARIGPALNLHPCYPADDSDAARAAATLYDGYENRLYLDSVLRGRYPADVLDDLGPDSRMVRGIRDGDLAIIGSPVDLLAVQYYTPYYVTADGGTEPRWPTSEAFWQQIYPDGLYDIADPGDPRLRPGAADHHRERAALPRPARRRTAASTTPAGCGSCATTSPRRTGPSPTGCRWRATTCGR